MVETPAPCNLGYGFAVGPAQVVPNAVQPVAADVRLRTLAGVLAKGELQCALADAGCLAQFGDGYLLTVPIGGGVGKLVRVGELPVDRKLQAFYNAEKPDGAATWALQFQFKLLFPKGGKQKAGPHGFGARTHER